MAGEPENVVLILLRRIDERTERMSDDLQDLKIRMTSVEEGLAGVNRRLDRLDQPVRRHDHFVIIKHRCRCAIVLWTDDHYGVLLESLNARSGPYRSKASGR